MTMIKQTKQAKLFPYLTLAGAIPFVGCLLLLLAGIAQLPYLGDTTHILKSYGIVIASFMLGSQWGNHLSLLSGNPWSKRLPIFTNVITITLWVGYLLLSTDWFCLLLSAGFAVILLVDHLLKQADIIQPDYYRIRVIVTMIVVASLFASGLTLF